MMAEMSLQEKKKKISVSVLDRPSLLNDLC